MKDITNTKLKVLMSKTGYVYYNYNEKTVNYAKVEFGVVKNPFTDKIEIAVSPFVKNAYEEFVPLYSYEEDLQYQHYIQICNTCLYNKTPIPSDINAYVLALLQKKEFARKQADEYVRQFMPELPQDASTSYTRSEWRDDVINSEVARELLEEYYNSIKK